MAQCYGMGRRVSPVDDSCRAILNDLDVGKEIRIFGEGDVDVKLPFTLYSCELKSLIYTAVGDKFLADDQRCSLNVRSFGLNVGVSWYALWFAAQTLSVCVQLEERPVYMCCMVISNIPHGISEGYADGRPWVSKLRWRPYSRNSSNASSS